MILYLYCFCLIRNIHSFPRSFIYVSIMLPERKRFIHGMLVISSFRLFIIKYMNFKIEKSPPWNRGQRRWLCNLRPLLVWARIPPASHQHPTSIRLNGLSSLFASLRRLLPRCNLTWIERDINYSSIYSKIKIIMYL